MANDSRAGFAHLMVGILLLVVMLVGVVSMAFFLTSGKRLSLSSQAGVSLPKITLAADSLVLTADNDVDVAVFVDPNGSKLTMAVIKFKFDTTKLNLDSFKLADGLDLVRATTNEISNKRGVLTVEFTVPPGNGPLTTAKKVVDLNFSKDDAVTSKVTSSVSVDTSAVTTGYVIPAGSMLMAPVSPLDLTVKGKPVVNGELGLTVSSSGEGEDLRVTASWKKTYEKNGIVGYRVIIKDANGVRVSTDPAGVGISYSKTFTQTAGLSSGNYMVQLTAVYPTQNVVQTKQFGVTTNEMGIVTNLNAL